MIMLLPDDDDDDDDEEEEEEEEDNDDDVVNVDNANKTIFIVQKNADDNDVGVDGPCSR